VKETKNLMNAALAGVLALGLGAIADQAAAAKPGFEKMRRRRQIRHE